LKNHQSIITLKKIVLFSLLLLSTLSKAQENFPKIDSLLNVYDKQGAPGVSVGVVKNGNLVYEKYTGFDDISKHRHASKKSLYNIASDSKKFTAACVVLLSQQGKLNLDNKLSKYFPQFPAYASNITIKMLLNHTSGIKDYLMLAVLKGSDEGAHTSADVLNWLAVQETNYEPGKGFSYSNSNYFLLIQIVEQTSGMSINKFAEKFIFKPLKMNDTQYSSRAEFKFKNKAIGYAVTETEFVPQPDTDKVIGGGGVYTTVRDLAKWLNEMKTQKLLGKAFWDTMLNNDRTKLSETIYYSKGYFIEKRKDGTELFFHGGDLQGYHTDVAYLPAKDVGVIILSNSNDIKGSAFTDPLLQIVLREPLTAKVPHIETPITYFNLPFAELPKFTGMYAAGNQGMTISTLGNSLCVLQHWDRSSYLIKPIGENTFVVPGEEITFHFTDFTASKPGKMIIGQNGTQLAMSRITDHVIEPSFIEYFGTFYNKALDATYLIYEDAGFIKCKVPNNKEFIVAHEDKDVFTMDGMEVKYTRTDNKVSGFTLSHSRAKNFKFDKI